jgi:hypothetical protein
MILTADRQFLPATAVGAIRSPAWRGDRANDLKGGHVEPTRYRITVRGRLTKRLGSAFEGLDLEPGIEQSALVGEIRDQSHLYGVLDLVRGLGLDLVSVETNCVTSEPGDEEGPRQSGECRAV